MRNKAAVLMAVLATICCSNGAGAATQKADAGRRCWMVSYSFMAKNGDGAGETAQFGASQWFTSNGRRLNFPDVVRLLAATKPETNASRGARLVPVAISEVQCAIGVPVQLQ